MHTGFCSENLTGKDHLGGLGIGRMIILKRILKEQGVGIWIGFNWLRAGSCSRHL
jgi:hypothetical protein